MTRRSWIGVMVGSLVVLAGCHLPGGEPPEPEPFFEAASVTPGDCESEDSRYVRYLADLSSTEGVSGVWFKYSDNATLGLGPLDVNGVVDHTGLANNGAVISGVFEALGPDFVVLATSDPIGPITIATCGH